MRALFAPVEGVHEAPAHEVEVEGLHSSMKELSTHPRVGTEVVEQRTTAFEGAGVFRLEFDNSYSWYNSKNVKYTLRVHQEVAVTTAADADVGGGGEAVENAE